MNLKRKEITFELLEEIPRVIIRFSIVLLFLLLKKERNHKEMEVQTEDCGFHWRRAKSKKKCTAIIVKMDD